MSALADLVADRGTVLLDGAMGTELFARGLPIGESPERWNVDEPDRVTRCTPTTSPPGPTWC